MKMADCTSRLRRRVAARGAMALLAGVVSLVPAAAAPAPGANRIKEIRFWPIGDSTRIAVEVSGEFKYRNDRLSNPDRVFFDLLDTRPETDDKKMRIIPVGNALLKQIRVAETQPGMTRVVLDLEPRDPPVEFTVSQLSHPDRLVVELRLPLPSGTAGSKTLTEAPARAPGAGPVAASERSEVLNAPAPERAIAEPAPRRFEPPTTKPEPKPDPKTPVLAPMLLALTALPPRAPLAGVNLHPLLPGPPDAVAPEPTVPLLAAKPARTPAPKAPPVGLDSTPARRTATGEESLTRALGLKLGRVVIDPGHGGHDQGTHGPSGLTEKEVVLDIARRVGALVEARLHSEVVYTRDDDTFIPLEERTRIANDSRADLFLSIHANSSPVRGVSGVETYYLNFTTSRTALELAARENSSAQSSIFDLQEVLRKIAMKDKIDESREFASRVQTSLFAMSAKSNTAARNRGIKKAPFVVLIGASMPSVLAEIGFLTNASDEALLRKPEQRQRIADALYRGIASYADTLSHFTVAKRE